MPAHTLETSNFLTVYAQFDSKPRFLHHLEGAVERLIQAHARQAGITTAAADAFFVQLRTNAITTAISQGGTDEYASTEMNRHPRS